MSTYSGISLLRHTDEGLQPVSRIADYSGFTRNIRIDEKDRIWVTVLGVGFVRLTLSEDKCSVVEARNYDLAAGTDGNVFSTRIDQELILCCDDPGIPHRLRDGLACPRSRRRTDTRTVRRGG